jgi:hypothetical protein
VTAAAASAKEAMIFMLGSFVGGDFYRTDTVLSVFVIEKFCRNQRVRDFTNPLSATGLLHNANR